MGRRHSVELGRCPDSEDVGCFRKERLHSIGFEPEQSMSRDQKAMRIRSEPRNRSEKYHQTARVLIVEDSPTISRTLSTLLVKEYHYDVLLAESYEECHEILDSQADDIAVAVAGLVLPDACHGEVIDLIQSVAVPVIVLTGRIDEKTRRQVFGKQVVDYILKENKHSVEYGAALVHRIIRNRSTKVMVVDDSPSFRRHLVELLRQLVLQTFAARDGVEALEILERHPDIQLALVDYHMPRMDGLEFTKTVRESYAKDRLSIIVLSGEEATDTPSRMLKSGANDFIRKPFSREEFYLRIHSNLEIQELFRGIREKAQNDVLTGLFNRRHFFELAPEKHRDAVNDGEKLALAAIDIDFFKRINDNFGHDIGDVAISSLGKMLKTVLPEDAIPARLGGEEFSVLMSYSHRDALVAFFEDFRRQIAEQVIPTPTEPVQYTISIGLELEPGDSLEDMLKRADAKLYRAKREGRNRVVY